MNKTLLLTLAIVAGVSCSDAIAKNKKTVTPVEQAPQKTIINLQSKADSVNYAAGKAFTQGMMEYVQGQLKVDTTCMADFREGLHNGLNIADTPQAKAKAAGEQIATMVRDRMIPNLQEQLKGTSVDFNSDLFKRGFEDAVENDNSVLSVEESAKYFEAKSKQLKDEKAAILRAPGEAWLAENAKKDSVKTTASGLQYKIIKQGTGDVATKDDEVVVKYEGKLTDGTVFDSSYTRDPQTTNFKPTQVIKGWTEALTMMPAGSEWELYIPQNLGYGERQAGKIPPYSTLIFKVELVEVKKAAAKTEATADKATAAKTTTAAKAAKTVKKAVAKKTAKK